VLENIFISGQWVKFLQSIPGFFVTEVMHSLLRGANIMRTLDTEKNVVYTGLDILEETDFQTLAGAKVGLLVNQASVNRNFIHSSDIFKNSDKYELKALFGPQHGIYGTTQANMIEWYDTVDNRSGIPVYSLYGNHRKPVPEMLKDIDTFVVDLPDIGSRYYTYLWTAKLCMEACAENNIRMVVLDRPNPIDGVTMEGPALDREFRSFVGLFEIPTRHGMTMGELLMLIKDAENIPCDLEIVKIRSWKRESYADQTEYPWVLPSPNMPTVDTAVVYPGFCLLEATNVSEGRGTCRPFEICGAPFIEAYEVVEQMNRFRLPGVIFRPTYFEPTFDKFKGETCGGFQMHITDREKFKPVRTCAAFLTAVKFLYPDKFRWTPPPYEYEEEKMPIDILWGNSSLRESLENSPEPGVIDKLQQIMDKDMEKFRRLREKYLLYHFDNVQSG
jgi:uncharacterized protein YbbC (DUF1343 family)